MIYKIAHKTTYTFESPVFFEPHYLRFRPRNAPHLMVDSFAMQVSPTAVGFSEHFDSENNIVNFCWFEGEHRQLSIDVEMTLRSEAFNPFSFLIYPLYYTRCPFEYDSALQSLLSASMEVGSVGEQLKALGEAVLSATENDTLRFLTELTGKIHEDFELIIRETGRAFEPNETFGLRQGSCRDLAWMQVHLLRSMGFAARFVSGYYYVVMEKPEYELHAWLEVYIPGGGWIGFDPSHGSVATHAHIPVSSSAHYDNTMAVSGTLRGRAASHMDTDLVIELMEG